ncbi:hypothetical protein HYH02_010600 [Chlamydomonas schloesseri]|uniref:Acyltransferase n=1 Tax=Chlamydomonas schloesseri TaxID=2026947 RepID=A0A835W3Z7_9CHLO|nr:hypothetical protein HYH02_010600 [Chlamydomonas schloesseri]|eukprot:KAG2439722.1 hypothetical protein HYH02_010600 [Chlamydomonas schloesseri]
MAIDKAPTNVRIWSDGVTEHGKQSLFSSAVAMVTLFIYCGWMHVLLALVVLSFWYRWALVTVLVLYSTLLLPPKPVLWGPVCRSWIFQTWREYFKFSYVFEEVLDSKKKYIFAEFPHGVFPMGPLIGATECQIMFPGFDIFGLAANVVFTVPFWRHFVAWLGSVPATTKDFKRVLKKGSVAVIVGGIAEMYMQSRTKEQIMLKDRKGFVRVAVEEGVDGGIVPVYHFGNSQVLDFGPQAMASVSRRLRAALGFLYGVAYLPLPRRRNIYMVCGKPVPVTRVARDDPKFEEVVDATHAAVMAALQEAYDRHKAEYGWAGRPLVIS